MGYVRVSDPPSVVFHYTRRENLDSILRDGKIKRMGDSECWFCCSLEDTLALMRDTVMVEGKPFYRLNGSLGYYPKFISEDYVILKLTPRWQNGEWVRWMQEVPPNAPKELAEEAYRFSMLKLGFRGDMKFHPKPEVLEVTPLLVPQTMRMEQTQQQSM